MTTDKKEQLMKAAAAVFSKYGYRKATIDEIVAGAGISKGLFYHYFTDKKELYLQLYNTYAELLSRNINDKADLTETDFFERLRAIAHLRIEFISRYPDLWGFLYSAYYEEHKDVAPLIRMKNERLLIESYSGSASNIDWTKFRDGITPDKAISIITWISDGFVRKLNTDRLEMDEKLYEEFDQYLFYMRDGLYK